MIATVNNGTRTTLTVGRVTHQVGVIEREGLLSIGLFASDFARRLPTAAVLGDRPVSITIATSGSEQIGAGRLRAWTLTAFYTEDAA